MRSRARGGSRYSRPTMTISRCPAAAGTTPFTRETRLARLPALLRERILVLDGAMGTLLQRHALHRGRLPRRAVRAITTADLRGDNDLLCLTQPDAVRDVHRAYLAAGADIISTNSFTATRIAQADYDLGHLAREINEAAARLAREAADEAEARDGRPRYVAGALGPTNRTASLSPDVNDPAARNVSFEELAEAYRGGRRGPDRGRRRPPAARDDLRHAQRQGRDLRDRRAVRGPGRSASRW